MVLIKGVWGGIVCLAVFLLVIPIIMILGKRGKLISSRKAVHIFGGLYAVCFPWLGEWQYIFATEVTAAILLFVLRLTSVYGKRRQEEAMGDFLYDTGSLNSYGEVLFPITMAILTWFTRSDPIRFITPMVILAISDSCAAYFGKKFGKEHVSRPGEDHKTIAGSAAFFASSFVITISTEMIFTRSSVLTIFLIALIVAIAATVFEMTASYGLDNLFVPITVYLLLDILLDLSITGLLLRFSYMALSFLLIYILWLLHKVSTLLYLQISMLIGLCICCGKISVAVGLIVSFSVLYFYQRNWIGNSECLVRPMAWNSILTVILLCFFHTYPSELWMEYLIVLGSNISVLILFICRNRRKIDCMEQ